MSVHELPLRTESGRSQAAAPPPPQPNVRLVASDEEAIDLAEAAAVRVGRDAARRDRERILPLAEYEDIASSGLLGITVPKAHGGAGASYRTLARVVALIAAADASLGQLFVSSAYAIRYIGNAGSAEQQEHYFGRILAGWRFGNASSERTGTHAMSLSTRLEASGSGFRVSGRKFYSTGALLSHLISAVCVDDDGRVVTAVVENGAPGLTIIDDWDGMGQRTTASGTLVLDNVVVGPRQVFASRSAEDVLPTGSVAQIVHAAIDLGIADGAIAATLAYVRDKARPWAGSGVEHAHDDPYIIDAVAELQIRRNAAEAILDRGAAALDYAVAHPSETARARAAVAIAEAKVLTTEVALAATNRLFQLGGASSTRLLHGFDRFWRDARTHTVHDPVHWKYRAIGDFYLNGKLPPASL